MIINVASTLNGFMNRMNMKLINFHIFIGPYL